MDDQEKNEVLNNSVKGSTASAGGLDAETFETQNVTASSNTIGNSEKQENTTVPTSTSYVANEKNTYYAGNTANVAEEPKQSKALEICALVFGILGIVCCCCYGLFGLVGLILSIIALATGKKSGLSIAGLTCSIVGLLLTVVMFVVGLSDYGKKTSDEFLRDFTENSVVNEVVCMDYDEDVM